jgi:hypothetical protein
MPLPHGLITGKTARLPGDLEKHPLAAGRPRHEPGKMNKRELQHAEDLKIMTKAGELLWWAFEPMRLRLADRTTYTPDFLVMKADGSLEFQEVKGFMEDDAAVKFKVASEMYWMFSFVIVK